MKYAVRMLVIAVTFFPLLASAQLGQSEKIVAQVPFQFRAGNTIFPAGKCTVQRIDHTGNALVVNNWEAKTSQFTFPSQSENAAPSQSTALVFHKYGDPVFPGRREGRRQPHGLSDTARQGRSGIASPKRFCFGKSIARAFEVSRKPHGSIRGGGLPCRFRRGV